MLVETNATVFSSVDCEHAPFIKDISRNVLFSTLFSVGKVSRCYKSHWRVWDKTHVIRYVFWNFKLRDKFNFTGKNLKFMIGQDCYLFQFGHHWKKLTLTFIFLPLQSWGKSPHNTSPYQAAFHNLSVSSMERHIKCVIQYMKCFAVISSDV